MSPRWRACSSERIKFFADCCRFDNPLPESPASSGDDADKPSTSGAADHGALADSPLSELLTMSLPEGLHVSVQAADVLLLLKVLEALNRCAALCASSFLTKPCTRYLCAIECVPACFLQAQLIQTLCMDGSAIERSDTTCRLGKHLALYQDGQAGKMDRKATSYPVSARDEFVNQKVAPKLAQQLKVRTTSVDVHMQQSLPGVEGNLVLVLALYPPVTLTF